MSNTPYASAFFARNKQRSRASAERIVPLVLEFVQPASIIDVGCGAGRFLAAFRECGVSDLLGIDGDYIDRSQLVIPQSNFQAVDLARPFALERSYDLAISLEVAEHLAPASASTFVASLVQLAPVVLFSAAIPGQGGTHHVNEQWPDYWAALFAAHGYVPVDALRKRIWNDTQINYWYRQNMLFFCSPSAIASSSTLRRECATSMLSVVHPELYLAYTRQARWRKLLSLWRK